MTLGRAFDRDDRGLLLAVALDADGRPAGFCQYVPARAIDGWSLDLMRRSERRIVPNGLTEFDRRRHDRAPSQGGLRRARAQLRDVPCRARQRSRRPVRAPRAEVVPRADERLDADRVAVDVQREVPTGVAPALRVLRLARAPARARRSRLPGRSRSSSCRSSAGSSCRRPTTPSGRPPQLPVDAEPARTPSAAAARSPSRPRSRR